MLPLRSIVLPVLESSTLPLLSMMRVRGLLVLLRAFTVAFLPEVAVRVLAVALLPERPERIADEEDLPERPAFKELLLVAELDLYTPVLLPDRLCVRLL